MTAFYHAASPAARAIRKAEGSRGVRTRDHHAPGRENRTKEAAMTIPSGEASAAASRRESRLPGRAQDLDEVRIALVLRHRGAGKSIRRKQC